MSLQNLRPAPMPLLVTEREASRLLSMSQRTLWSLRKEGRLPVVRVGTSAASQGRLQIRYAVSDLVAFIEKAKSENDQRPA